MTTPPYANDNIVGEGNSNSEYYINNDWNDPDGGAPCPVDIASNGLTVLLTLTASIHALERFMKDWMLLMIFARVI